jgi:RHS repeat-associated protein
MLAAVYRRRRTRASRTCARRGGACVVGSWIRGDARDQVGPATYAYDAAPAENFVYDADGNLVADGLGKALVWDGDGARQRVDGIAPRDGRQAESRRVPFGRRDEQKRLLSVTPILPATGAKRITYAYDGQGRRIRSNVSTWSGTVWTPSQETWFTYDGWNVVEERIQTTSITTRRYTWGLDLSGSLQGAGGVGGLVRADTTGSTTTTWWYHYDGNGNVTELTNNSAAVIAHYRYTAFGETNVATGSAAVANTYRFSTKSLEPVSGYYYYGFRYYNPSTGRWPSRDPIGEEGGENVYGMIGNQPSNKIDFLGLFPASAPSPTAACANGWVAVSVAWSQSQLSRTIRTPWYCPNRTESGCSYRETIVWFCASNLQHRTTIGSATRWGSPCVIYT